jgi:CheY-like chemotaxis protein
MRILIVEDDQNKLKQLASFIMDRWPDFEITERRSYRSGLAEIVSNHYDLILLDMSMPTFDKTPEESGGRTRIFAGREILWQMAKRDIRTATMIVTQFESFGEGVDQMSLSELEKDLETAFSTSYLATVYYNAAHENWKEALVRHIERARKVNSAT